MKPLDAARWVVARAYQSQGDDDYDITNMKMQKLLFFAQSMSLHHRGVRLFDSEVQAWDHGPVIPDVYHAFKAHGHWRIPHGIGETLPSGSVSEEEEAVLRLTWDKYGGFSASMLRKISHADEGSWAKWYAPGEKHVVINDLDMADDAMDPDVEYQLGNYDRFLSTDEFLASLTRT